MNHLDVSVTEEDSEVIEYVLGVSENVPGDEAMRHLRGSRLTGRVLGFLEEVSCFVSRCH